MTGFYVQHQEDHPHNPGWWRFSRPVFIESGEPPQISESVRFAYCSRQEAEQEQERWDAIHPRG